MAESGYYNKDVHPALVRSFIAAGYSVQRVIAELQISEETFYDWRSQHEEFDEAVLFGQSKAVARVEQAIFNRAMGFEYTETHHEEVSRETEDGTFTETKDKTITKMALPDVGAQRAFLAAYSPKRWGPSVAFGGMVDEAGNTIALPNIQITFTKPGETPKTDGDSANA